MSFLSTGKISATDLVHTPLEFFATDGKEFVDNLLQVGQLILGKIQI